MTRSDNTATDVLLKRIGGMETVRKMLERVGIKVGEEGVGEINPVNNTKRFLQLSWPELFDIEDPTPVAVKYANLDVEKPRLAALYQASAMPPNPSALDDQPRDKTSPAAMVDLLTKVVACDGLSVSVKDRLLAVMERCHDKRRFRAGLPNGVKAGNKTGTIRGCQNDVGWVSRFCSNFATLTRFRSMPRLNPLSKVRRLTGQSRNRGLCRLRSKRQGTNCKRGDGVSRDSMGCFEACSDDNLLLFLLHCIQSLK